MFVLAEGTEAESLKVGEKVTVIFKLKAGKMLEDGQPDGLMQGQGPDLELVSQEMSRLAKHAA